MEEGYGECTGDVPDFLISSNDQIRRTEVDGYISCGKREELIVEVVPTVAAIVILVVCIDIIKDILVDHFQISFYSNCRSIALSRGLERDNIILDEVRRLIEPITHTTGS